MNPPTNSTKPKLVKALLIAEIIFVCMYFGAYGYTYFRPLMTGQDLTIFLWNVDVLLALIVPGYVAAQLFKSHRFALGIGVGLASSSIAIIPNVFEFGIHSAVTRGLGLLLWGAFLGGIGGLLSWVQALIVRSRARVPLETDRGNR